MSEGERVGVGREGGRLVKGEMVGVGREVSGGEKVGVGREVSEGRDVGKYGRVLPRKKK